MTRPLDVMQTRSGSTRTGTADEWDDAPIDVDVAELPPLFAIWLMLDLVRGLWGKPDRTA